MGAFLGPLPPFDSQGVRLIPKGAGDTRPEAFSLVNDGHQGASLVDAAPRTEIRKRFGTGNPHLGFQGHQLEFFRQGRVHKLHVVPDALKRGVEAQTRLHRDDQKVKRVG